MEVHPFRVPCSVFRVPCSVFRVPCSVFKGRKVFGYKSISRTPTSDIESFVGWSLNGRATSVWNALLLAPHYSFLIPEFVVEVQDTKTFYSSTRKRSKVLRTFWGLSVKWNSVISRTPTSEIESFAGLSLSGRATSGSETSFLTSYFLTSYFLTSCLFLVALPLLILNFLHVDQKVGGRHLFESRPPTWCWLQNMWIFDMGLRLKGGVFCF